MNSVPPGLEERFTEPEGWKWHSYRRVKRILRFGSLMPDNHPKGHIVFLPGLSEFGEKFFELARDCKAQGFGFWVIDWFGQGGSGRYFKGSQKRYSADFSEDVADLHALISDFVLAPDVPSAPLVLLAHSMGGNLGLRYLETHPSHFVCAGFSAPMWGLKVFEKLPDWLTNFLTCATNRLMGTSYAPGEGDWDSTLRKEEGDLALSKDPVRVKIHVAWSEARHELRLGGVTHGWLREAVKSCKAVSKPDALAHVHIPCLIGMAGEDRLVDNRKMKIIVDILEDAKLLKFPDARHELLMERDAVRGVFLGEFFALAHEITEKRSDA